MTYKRGHPLRSLWLLGCGLGLLFNCSMGYAQSRSTKRLLIAASENVKEVGTRSVAAAVTESIYTELQKPNNRGLECEVVSKPDLQDAGRLLGFTTVDDIGDLVALQPDKLKAPSIGVKGRHGGDKPVCGLAGETSAIFGGRGYQVS